MTTLPSCKSGTAIKQFHLPGNAVGEVLQAPIFDVKNTKCNAQQLCVPIMNKSKHELPEYQSSAASGMDLRANISEPITILPQQRMCIPTGIYLSIPTNYEAQIRPHSGLALKSGITVLNGPGTIDSDYRGEIKIILINHSKEVYTINDGNRIAQIVFNNIQ